MNLKAQLLQFHLMFARTNEELAEMKSHLHICEMELKLKILGLSIFILFESGQYDVVGERDIHVNDNKWGIVFDKSKPFLVEIKCRGELTLLAALLVV